MYKNNKKNVFFLIVTCFGIGKIPIAPGTFGSVIAFPLQILIYYLMTMMGLGENILILLLSYILFLIAITVIGWYATTKYLLLTRKKDPSEVVIDELLGQLLTNLGASLSPIIVARSAIDLPDIWIKVIFAFIVPFVFFRLFDITKPWPIKYVEKMPGAAGVILDDILAALFAIVFNYVTLFLFLDFFS